MGVNFTVTGSNIRTGGSTSLHMPGFVHDPRTSDYSTLMKEYNKKQTLNHLNQQVEHKAKVNSLSHLNEV